MLQDKDDASRPEQNIIGGLRAPAAVGVTSSAPTDTKMTPQLVVDLWKTDPELSNVKVIFYCAHK